MANALIARTFELFEGKPAAQVGLIQLLRTLAGIPHGLVFRKYPPDLIAVDPVAARIGGCIFGIGNSRAKHNLGYDLSQFANAIVLIGAAHVESFVEYFFYGRMED